MGQIFSSARRVFAWSGGENACSNELIDDLNTIGSLIGNSFAKDGSLLQQDPVDSVPYYDPLTNTLNQHFGQTTKKNDYTPISSFWSSFLRSLERPYRYRSWVVRSSCSHETRFSFFCGSRVVSWSALAAPAATQRSLYQKMTTRPIMIPPFPSFEAENKSGKKKASKPF